MRLIRFSGRTPDHGDNVLYETPVEGIGLPLCFYLYGVSDERRRKKYGLPSASDERHYRGGDYRCIWRGMADNMKVASAILGFLEGRIPPPEFGTTDSRCFIATAAYGNSSDPEILIFKRFRDEILLSSGAGRFAVDLYDRVSPALAKLVRKYRPLRVGLRFILTPMAKILTLFFR